MAQKSKTKLDRAFLDLQHALKFYEDASGDEPAAFFAVAKVFEVSVEYAWKEMKRRLEEKGVTDVFAPKDVIRKAAQVGLISNAERWLNYVDARNDSVHDYYGMTQSEYIKIVREFLKDAKKVFDN